MASNVKPPVRAGFDLDHQGFRRCGQFQGTPTKYQPVTLQCAKGAIGQYAYVYLEQQDHLQMAEFEAFGLRKYPGIPG